jgi:hypothetical protein
MIGLINLSGVGIITGGLLIALIIYSVPKLKIFAPHPLLAFLEGIVVAYILDDVSGTITYGDIIVIALTIATIIVMLIPILQEWFKGRKQKLEEIKGKIDLLNNKIYNLEGKVETILNLYPRKK